MNIKDSINAQIINESIAQNVELELQFSDNKAMFYCLKSKNDTVKLVIDLVENTINIEVYMFNDSGIDTVEYGFLSEAIRTMKVYSSIQKAYKQILEPLRELMS